MHKCVEASRNQLDAPLRRAAGHQAGTHTGCINWPSEASGGISSHSWTTAVRVMHSQPCPDIAQIYSSKEPLIVLRHHM